MVIWYDEKSLALRWHSCFLLCTFYDPAYGKMNNLNSVLVTQKTNIPYLTDLRHNWARV